MTMRLPKFAVAFALLVILTAVAFFTMYLILDALRVSQVHAAIAVEQLKKLDEFQDWRGPVWQGLETSTTSLAVVSVTS